MPAEDNLIASSSAALRRELSLRNREYAGQRGLTYRESYGSSPVVCYLPEQDSNLHGNFFPASYKAICRREDWARRLAKVHTSARMVLPREDRRWRELDSCNSSDALLMNVFCCPGVLKNRRLLNLLGLEAAAEPEFGFRARVPLDGGKTDRTEVDMRIGDLLVESKLTESGFQTASAESLRRYPDFNKVFSLSRLPRIGKSYASYQLIRNVLAAHHNHCSFCVIHDARRPDLRESWFAVMSAVKILDLRLRCKVLTWQELAQVLSSKLQRFLCEKYGIGLPGCGETADIYG